MSTVATPISAAMAGLPGTAARTTGDGAVTVKGGQVFGRMLRQGPLAAAGATQPGLLELPITVANGAGTLVAPVVKAAAEGAGLVAGAAKAVVGELAADVAALEEGLTGGLLGDLAQTLSGETEELVEDLAGVVQELQTSSGDLLTLPPTTGQGDQLLQLLQAAPAPVALPHPPSAARDDEMAAGAQMGGAAMGGAPRPVTAPGAFEMQAASHFAGQSEMPTAPAPEHAENLGTGPSADALLWSGPGLPLAGTGEPARTATRPITAPVAIPVEQIAVPVARAVEQGERRLVVRLDPPELGRVEVVLEPSGTDAVRIAVAVERPETLDLLRRDAGQLDQALARANLKLDGGLQFSLQQHGQGWGGDRDGHAHPALIEPGESGPGSPDGPEPASQPRLAAGRAGIDIIV